MHQEGMKNPSDYAVNFSANQPLPPGYTVQWWESNESYQWVIDENIYGVEHHDRFRARRDAWAHFNAQ